MSCLVDGLCPIIFPAPFILSSIETANRIDNLSPISMHSCIISLTIFRVEGSSAILSKDAPVSALTGLKEQLPHNLIQISSLILFF